MADSDKVFSASIPKLYDTYLVPMIFEAYAEDIADRAVAFSPKMCSKQRRVAVS